MKEYTYSFIIPHHNCPDLLNRLIGTIPMRDDIEIIVVDDKSDETKKPRITARPDVKILYISKEESKGAGKARNVGMAEATGKWLMFADADDFYKEGFIDILDEYKDKDIDVLYYGFDYLYSDTLEPVKEPFDIQEFVHTFDGSKYSEDCLRYRNNVPWSKMVRRDFVIKYNMYFEHVINGNDFLFSIFVGFFLGKFNVDKRSLYVYLQNRDSLTNIVPSLPIIMCRYKHFVQHNKLNSFLGYSKWNISIPKYVLSIVKYKDFRLFYSFIKSIITDRHSIKKESIFFVTEVMNRQDVDYED